MTKTTLQSSSYWAADFDQFAHIPRTQHNSTVSNDEKIDYIQDHLAPYSLHAYANADVREINDGVETMAEGREYTVYII